MLFTELLLEFGLAEGGRYFFEVGVLVLATTEMHATFIALRSKPRLISG
jgi:hypothetical protein